MTAEEIERYLREVGDAPRRAKCERRDLFLWMRGYVFGFRGISNIVQPMPARDFYHDIVRNALVKDGWTITHDPYPLKLGRKDLFIDWGAEKILAAERGNDKTAVEIKSFVGRSVAFYSPEKRKLTEFALA